MIRDQDTSTEEGMRFDPTVLRRSVPQYVSYMLWEQNWADRLVQECSRLNVDPHETVFLILALSAALEDHRKALIELVPSLDETSGTHLQWVPIGIAPYTIHAAGASGNPSSGNEKAVVRCLTELKDALMLSSVPEGAIALLTCRHGQEGELVFDLGVHAVREQSVHQREIPGPHSGGSALLQG